MLAVQGGDAKTVKMLCALSNVQAKDHKGHTAGDLAARRVARNIALGVSVDEEMALLMALKNAGARWARPGDSSFPSLAEAIKKKARVCADFLAMSCPQAAQTEKEAMKILVENPQWLPGFAAWMQAKELAAELAGAANAQAEGPKSRAANRL